MTAKDRVVLAVEKLLAEAKQLPKEGATRGDVTAALIFWDKAEEGIEAAIQEYMRTADEKAPR